MRCRRSRVSAHSKTDAYRTVLRMAVSDAESATAGAAWSAMGTRSADTGAFREHAREEAPSEGDPHLRLPAGAQRHGEQDPLGDRKARGGARRSETRDEH